MKTSILYAYAAGLATAVFIAVFAAAYAMNLLSLRWLRILLFTDAQFLDCVLNIGIVFFATLLAPLLAIAVITARLERKTVLQPAENHREGSERHEP